MKIALALFIAIVVPGGLVLLALHYGQRLLVPSGKLAADQGQR